MRTEKDFLGEVQLTNAALYGINSWRAIQNFPDRTELHKEWYQAIGLVKLACYQTAISFKNAAKVKYPEYKVPDSLNDEKKWDLICQTAKEVAVGKYFNHFIVPAVQGGAGTSINMNVNEIIANASLKKMGKKPGEYSFIDPFEHSNIFQSTNDVVPTALKVACMQLFIKIEKEINELRSTFEKIEKEYRSSLRVAYTQMQKALPSSYGLLISAYNDALARDWWRISKCFERIKTVNLGGGAIGTGLTIPRFFIMEVVSQLQKLTNLPVTRSENHTDTTQNFDVFVEVHATIKASAVNIEKIASDIMLLSSGFMENREVDIPQKQAGSSIMPGKVNPVIPEFIISAANKIYSNDTLISSLCGKGNLDLNSHLPAIGHALLDSIKLLLAAFKTFNKNLVSEMSINSKVALEKILNCPTITTALIPFIGYNKASKLSGEMKKNDISIIKANKKLDLIPDAQLKKILKPEKLLQLGFSIADLD